MDSMQSVVTSNSEALIDLIEARRLASSGEAHAIRVACGLSLKDIAEAVGRTAGSISRWESGATVPYGPAARRYGRLLADLREHLTLNDDEPVADGLEVTTSAEVTTDELLQS